MFSFSLRQNITSLNFVFSFPFQPDASREESTRPEIPGQDCGGSDFAESSQSQYNFQA